MKSITITKELINSLKTERGGFSGATLRMLGVEWPPTSGWRSRIIGTSIEVDADRLEASRHILAKPSAAPKNIWKSRPEYQPKKAVVAAPSDDGYPQFTLYTDGSGPSVRSGAGGWGWVLLDVLRIKVCEDSGRLASTTNNRAEMTAAIKGLSGIPEGSAVRLISDSQIVLKGISGTWKRKANKDLWDVLMPLVKARRVSCEWVKGHSGNEHNERCDFLASEAAMELEFKEIVR